MKILVMHWGTQGGGPQMQLSVWQTLVDKLGDDAFLSFDANSEVAERLKGSTSQRLIVGKASRTLRLRLLYRLLAQPLDAWKLARFCWSHKIDVIYEVMDHPFQVAPRILARWLLGVKSIGSVHDAVRHLGEESRILAAISRISARHTDAIMTYSASVRKDVEASDTAPGVRIFESVHGAFGEPRGRMPRDLPATRPLRIGFFGRIERYKGLSRLGDAVSQLQGAGMAVELTIHGRGSLDADQRASLAGARATVDNRWVPDEEIQGVVDTFDLLALPYDEASQSGVVGFAISAGIPIVCTPVGGIEEQVRKANAGIVANDMTSEAFAHAVDAVIRDPSLYRAFSLSGLEAAVTMFSWERVAEDIIRVAGLTLEDSA